MISLSDFCTELRNYFSQDSMKFFDSFTVTGGAIDVSELVDCGALQEGQYFRVVGSVFNDGVYKYPDDNHDLTDEEFEGSVWCMRVPKEVLSLLDDINSWIAKYVESENSVIDSPFQSESFGGYSYTKSSGNIGSSGGQADQGTWQNQFRSRINRWRRIRV